MRILFIILSGCLCLCGRAQQNPPIDSREIINLGVQLHDSGEYKQALKVYEQIDRNDTNYVDALYERALSCELDSQFVRGLQYCEEALAATTQRQLEPQIYDVYGDILGDMKRTDESIAVFDRAIQKFPSYAMLYFNKGQVYLNLSRYREAEACFRQSLLIDPYLYSAHFCLGLVAIHEGKIIPAMLSLTGYLLVNPEGKYASRAISILDLIAKSKDEILAYKNDRTEEPDGDFASVEDIVLSKIALDKGYKPLLELDDPISRQIQVVFEKMEWRPESTDFWVQYYLPFFKSAFNNGKFEVLINWAFKSANVKSIREYVKRNKKAIDAFTTEAAAYFSLIRATRELQADKREAQTSRYLFQNDVLVGRGRQDANGTFLGVWEFYYPAGNLKSTGQFDEAGKRTGDWSFYFQNGKLSGKESYKNGQVEGEHLDYFESGLESNLETYSGNDLNGPSSSWYWTGSPMKAGNYKTGNLDGEYLEFYPNGSLHIRANYMDGKPEGPYVEYFKSGGPKYKFNFTANVIQGNYQQFFENGGLASEGTVTNGKVEGLWKYYFESGKLKMKRSFLSDHTEGPVEEYFENGVLSSRLNYKKGKLDGEGVFYDEDGKRYCQMDYSNDVLHSVTYYDKTGKVIGHNERNTDGWEHDLFLPDGSKTAHQRYDRKGLLTGTKTVYFASGAVSQTIEYQNDEMNGQTITYYRNGQKRTVQEWADGKQNGHYIGYFSNGGVQSEGWMRNDQAEGDWAYYDEMGNKTSTSYYQDGVLSGYRVEYAPNGRVSIEEQYHSGWLIALTQFDSTGHVLIRDSFPQGSGKYLLMYPTGNKMIEATLKQGDFDGAYTTYFFDGSVESRRFYKRGIQDSSYISFYYGGIKNTEGQYRNGSYWGTWNNYDEKGELSGSTVYDKDGIRKIETVYFPDGKKDFETPYKNDSRDGLGIKYDLDGVKSYAVRYREGYPVSYTYPDRDGNWVPEIKIKSGSFQLHANYANGRPSRQCTFMDGTLTGMDTLFYSNGKIRSIDSLVYGSSEGRRVLYTTSGRMKSESVSKNDNIQGVATEYFDNGKLAKETPFYNGSINGTEKIYDEQGHLAETRFYYYGKLLAIKK